jgi:flagellar protein FliS
MGTKESDMARMAAVRAEYAKDKVTTSPERLVTMLYDRLVRDLVGAEQALLDHDVEGAHRDLVHAQDILTELLGALDQAAWSGAPQLASLYVWVLGELMQANVHKDVQRVTRCRTLMAPLAEAWHGAAAAVATRHGQVEGPAPLLGAAV